MGVTITGMKEMEQAIREFPAAEQAALKEVARQTAEREKATARSLVRVDTGITRDSIVVTDDSEHHQFLVTVGPTPHPGHKGHWSTYVRDFLAWDIELGTKNMAARPFMRPASDQEQERYKSDMESASAAAAQKAFGE